jgi:hypothetical protein
MDAKTKKILIYSGSAVLVGAVGFFVYSFFKKDEFKFDNTTVRIGGDLFKVKPNQEPEDNRVSQSAISNKPFVPTSQISESLGWRPSSIDELLARTT